MKKSLHFLIIMTVFVIQSVTSAIAYAAENRISAQFADPYELSADGSSFFFGHYEQDNNTDNGPEPIAWQVLTIKDDHALLLSKYALETVPYNDEHVPVTWESSSLRKWLNKNFYNYAFNSSEKVKIIEAVNSNPDNPAGTDGGFATKDNVFLLSIDEVKSYFTSADERICKATQYALSRGNQTDESGSTVWWLRTPGTTSKSASNVGFSGSISSDYGYLNGFFVRPAIWVEADGSNIDWDMYDIESNEPEQSTSGSKSGDVYKLSSIMGKDIDIVGSIIGLDRDSFIVTLSPDGTGEIHYDEMESEITWEADRNNIYLYAEGEIIQGTLDNDSLTLVLEGEEFGLKKDTGEPASDNGDNGDILVPSPSDGYLIMYKIKTVNEIDVETLGYTEDRMVITILPNGKARVSYDGEEGDASRWELDEDTFYILINRKEVSGTLTGGTMILHMDGNTVVLKYAYSEFWGEDQYYEYKLQEDGTAKITGYTGSSQELTIPSVIDGISVTAIDNNAFSGDSSLTAVTIPDSVNSIGSFAFSGCSGLTSIYIPAAVKEIGVNPFTACTSLTEIKVDPGNPIYGDINGILFDKNSKELIAYPAGASAFTIPNGITSIADNAFYYITNLSQISIPDSVISIGKSAFEGCSGLTSVTIPDGITSIGEGVFRDCSNLKSVFIPASVTSIERSSFYGCSQLTLTVVRNSFANQWAVDNNVAFEYYVSPGFEKYAEEWQDYDYRILDDGSAEIITYTGSGREITIPAIIDGIRITSIGDQVFQDHKELIQVTVPKDIVFIGDSAFSGCSRLTSISLPNNLTSIGESAFSGCSGLTSITLPNSLTSIGESAFSGCSGLTSISLPNSLTSIGDSTFSGCSGLTSISLPNSLTSIGESAFSGCSGLTSITLPNSLTSIGDSAFSGCSGLTSISLPNSLTSIGNSTFSECSGLTSISLPNSLTSIGNSTFSGCSGLTTISLPNSLTSIGDSAFSGCSGLTSITLPDNLTSIGENAFSECDRLTLTVKRNSYAKTYADKNNINTVYFTAPEFADLAEYWQDYEYRLINNNTAMITDYTGSDQDIEIPSFINGYTVTAIDAYAFSEKNLISARIPDGITAIGLNAFYGNNGLISVTVPDSVASLDHSFDGCDEVYLIVGKGSYAEKWAIKYKVDLKYSDSSDNADKLQDYQYTILDDGTAEITAYTGHDREIMIPSVIDGIRVTSIGANSFWGNYTIRSLVIPEGVTTIGNSAFFQCEKLSSLVLPESLITIGYDAFRGLLSLTSVTIPNGVTTIKFAAFYNCPVLTSVRIPKSVAEMERDVFEKQDSLVLIVDRRSYAEEYAKQNGLNYVYPDTQKQKGITYQWNDFTYMILDDGTAVITGYTGSDQEITIPSVIDEFPVTAIGNSSFSYNNTVTAITIPDGVTSIGSYAFGVCKNLISVSIPDSVVSIGDLAFSSCFNLQSINIPDSITAIGAYTFHHCQNLTSITLPDGIESIGELAFGMCTNLTSISLPDKEIFIADDAFYGCDRLTRIIRQTTQDQAQKAPVSGNIDPVYLDFLNYLKEYIAGSQTEPTEPYKSYGCYVYDRFNFRIENAGYALWDIDNDGTPELLIGDAKYQILEDVYTLVNGQITAVLHGGYKKPIAVNADGIFSVVSMISAYEEKVEYYSYANGVLHAEFIGTPFTEAKIEFAPLETISSLPEGSKPAAETSDAKATSPEVYKLKNISGYTPEMTAAAFSISLDQLPEVITAELQPDGTGTLVLFGEKFNFFWSLNGSDLTIKNDSSNSTFEYKGKRENGEISLDMDGLMVVLAMPAADDGAASVNEQPDVSLSDISAYAETANKAEKSFEVGDIITFGHYEQDNNFSNGAEPIEWKILAYGDNNSLGIPNTDPVMLLVSTKVLDAMAFNNGGTNIWEDSSLRAWMQGTFYYDAFSNAERGAIEKATHKVKPQDPYPDTDTVFILSIDEIQKYLPAPSDRQFEATPYAISRSVFRGSNGLACWWTRSYYAKGKAYNIWSNGEMDHGDNVTANDGGILPAIYLNMKTWSNLK